jgi:hypothetical protein
VEMKKNLFFNRVVQCYINKCEEGYVVEISCASFPVAIKYIFPKHKYELFYCSESFHHLMSTDWREIII